MFDSNVKMEQVKESKKYLDLLTEAERRKRLEERKTNKKRPTYDSGLQVSVCLPEAASQPSCQTVICMFSHKGQSFQVLQ